MGEQALKIILRIFHKNWQGKPHWYAILIFALLLSCATILPGAIIEILDETGDKIWATIGFFFLSTVIFYFVYKVIFHSLAPIIVPDKPKLHVFIPINDKKVWSDAFLQYAGFIIGKEYGKYSDSIDLIFHDSSKKKWIDEIKKCIDETREDHPVWFVFTMSDKGKEVRERLELYLKKDPRLRQRLTALFTVSSSRFETEDRMNMFRLFVDGEGEAIAITEHIRHNIVAGTEDEVNVLCCRVNSAYGEHACMKIKERLENGKYNIDECIDEDIQNVDDINKYQLLILFTYDQGIRNIFQYINENNFTGIVLGGSTLSVKDWKKLINFKAEKVNVMHTAVSGFDENIEYAKAIKVVDYDYIVGYDKDNSKIIETDTVMEMNKDRLKFDAYKDLESNYITAFCADCVNLFAFSVKKGRPTLRSLLDDPRLDEERKRLTLIRDLDFGVTGDASVSIYMSKF